MKHVRTILIASVVAGSQLLGTAHASRAQDTIEQCRNAIEQTQGTEAVAKLSKIKSRGRNYEVWFNLKGTGEDMRSYCYGKPGEVKQLITENGRWKGRNPPRPEDVSF